jgi:hypothetical protein
VFIPLELGLRFAFRDSKDYTLEMWKYASYMKRISEDPIMAHEHIPGRSGHLMGVNVAINSKGLRDREFPYQKPANVKRVLMLGDSVTFGWGVEMHMTASKQLESLLNASNSGGKYEVINTGVGNYNTSMEVQYFLTRGVNYSPDIIILNYFINDAEETPRYSGNVFNEHLYSWVYFAGKFDTLMRRFHANKGWQNYYEDLYSDDAPGWSKAQAAIKRLGRYCKTAGSVCLLANYPELRKLTGYPFIQVNEKLEKLANEAGLDYFDLLPSVRGVAEESLWVTVPDPHPNFRANTYFAKAIYDRLMVRARPPLGNKILKHRLNRGA